MEWKGGGWMIFGEASRKVENRKFGFGLPYPTFMILHLYDLRTIVSLNRIKQMCICTFLFSKG